MPVPPHAPGLQARRQQRSTHLRRGAVADRRRLLFQRHIAALGAVAGALIVLLLLLLLLAAARVRVWWLRGLGQGPLGACCRGGGGGGSGGGSPAGCPGWLAGVTCCRGNSRAAGDRRQPSGQPCCSPHFGPARSGKGVAGRAPETVGQTFRDAMSGSVRLPSLKPGRRGPLSWPAARSRSDEGLATQLQHSHCFCTSAPTSRYSGQALSPAK